MKRVNPIWVLLGIALAALIYWVADNTHWADVKVPMPLKGEALRNRFYAVQRLAEALGARTVVDHVLTVPSPDSVIVLSDWHWNLSESRRQTMERWVESGGRLVVVGPLTGGEDAFEQWSGIERSFRDVKELAKSNRFEWSDPCHKFREERGGRPRSESESAPRWLCEVETLTFLKSARTPDWALREDAGIQAMRVSVGRGHVTVINASSPFTYRSLFDGDHGWLFVAATELRRGDDVHFLSEFEHPSLVALLWRYGAPVVVLGLAAIGLLLWRGSARFGPLAAPPESARRSLAEQIRGTGRFALRHGGESLHAACVRALEDAATRRIPGYAALPAAERPAALARLTGFDRDALAAAIHHGGLRGAHGLRSTIAFLESARRQVLARHTRSIDGTA
jgi:hypothetical protein